MATMVETALRKYGERLRARFGARPVSVRLFGSFARGEARPDSDVDVLVVLAGASWEDRVAALDLATEISLETSLCISAVVLSPEELEQRLRAGSSFARAAIEEGVTA